MDKSEFSFSVTEYKPTDSKIKTEIENELTQARDKFFEYLDKVIKLSDEHEITFYIAPLGYGSGHTYTPAPKRMTKEQALKLVRTNGVTEENKDEVAEALENDWEDSYKEYGWSSSSQNC